MRERLFGVKFSRDILVQCDHQAWQQAQKPENSHHILNQIHKAEGVNSSDIVLAIGSVFCHM